MPKFTKLIADMRAHCVSKHVNFARGPAASGSEGGIGRGDQHVQRAGRANNPWCRTNLQNPSIKSYIAVRGCMDDAPIGTLGRNQGVHCSGKKLGLSTERIGIDRRFVPGRLILQDHAEYGGMQAKSRFATLRSDKHASYIGRPVACRGRMNPVSGSGLLDKTDEDTRTGQGTWEDCCTTYNVKEFARAEVLDEFQGYRCRDGGSRSPSIDGVYHQSAVCNAATYFVWM